MQRERIQIFFQLIRYKGGGEKICPCHVAMPTPSYIIREPNLLYVGVFVRWINQANLNKYSPKLNMSIFITLDSGVLI